MNNFVPVHRKIEHFFNYIKEKYGITFYTFEDNKFQLRSKDGYTYDNFWINYIYFKNEYYFFIKINRFNIRFIFNEFNFIKYIRAYRQIDRDLVDEHDVLRLTKKYGTPILLFHNQVEANVMMGYLEKIDSIKNIKTNKNNIILSIPTIISQEIVDLKIIKFIDPTISYRHNLNNLKGIMELAINHE